ncbi:MAG: prepilin-type N-terminal cleavage/methylation domain-containing protein [Patescibacteria group bacterium]|nr:prepilin-type N-terminal cleavage/methylation domain-containing protein [Patescibacteria group bacterium]
MRGFTLIELLVVIAIIGILSSVVLASLNTARIKARDAERISDIRSLETALQLYYSDHSHFPACGSNEYLTAADAASGCLHTALVPGYISKIPSDPLYGTNGSLGWGYQYQYWVNDSVGSRYGLRAALEGTPLPVLGAYPSQSAGYCGTNLPPCNQGAQADWWYADCVYTGYGPSCNETIHVGS